MVFARWYYNRYQVLMAAYNDESNTLSVEKSLSKLTLLFWSMNKILAH